MTDFKDLFSSQSKIYAQVRPGYPKELFACLHDLCNEQNLAWDCATGNGQAAIALSQYFKKVWATDASVQQIEQAAQKENITYSVANATKSGLENASADLITVATALHWLPIEEFYAEVNRVLKPGGIFAFWSYWLPTIDKELDLFLNKLSADILKDYWAPEIQLVSNKYLDVHFPYQILPTVGFKTKAMWSSQQLKDYILSWSATQSFFRQHGNDSLNDFFLEIDSLWKGSSIKEASWDIYMKVGRKPMI